MGWDSKERSSSTEYLRLNREYWTSQAPFYAERAHRHWAETEITWGGGKIGRAHV